MNKSDLLAPEKYNIISEIENTLQTLLRKRLFIKIMNMTISQLVMKNLCIMRIKWGMSFKSWA